jgi:hypothetical protein
VMSGWRPINSRTTVASSVIVTPPLPSLAPPAVPLWRVWYANLPE